MHVFLQGLRNIGKSTVILKTIDLLIARRSLLVGGFFTWNGGKGDLNVYIRPAASSPQEDIYRLASWNAEESRLVCDIRVFEETGVRILKQSKGADLIIMDELGYLESNSPMFKQTVMDTISGDIPILGVLRLGDIPWQNDIKRNPKVTLYSVNEENRETLPQVILNATVHGVSEKLLF